MARLLPLILLLLAGLVLVVARRASAPRRRDGRTYRPRARTGRRADAGTPGVYAVRRRDLAGLRDAYSGEPLDASRPLVRCDGCQSLYHARSADVLARENGGRCASCGGTDFSAVELIDE